MKLDKISIIILNYNTTYEVNKLLTSINKYLDRDIFEIIVVDNNSPDREIEKLAVAFANVKFIFRDKNDGFGAGNNVGVNLASGKYLLMLNPDTELIDDSVIKLYDYIRDNENCGILSGVFVDKKGEILYCFNDFPSYSWEIYHLLGFGYVNKIKRLTSRPEIHENKAFQVDWFHGAFLFLRKKDFLDVGGFNEDYFMYYEDVELCYKIMKIQGKKNICLPDVRIIHLTQSTIENEATDNIYAFHINRGKILMFNNYGIIQNYILRLVAFLNIIIRLIILPVWSKFSGMRKEKFYQLINISKLYLSSKYRSESKYKYIKV